MNQPYNSAYQQKDGLANGAILGGLAGLGGGAIAHRQNWKYNNGELKGLGDRFKGLDSEGVKKSVLEKEGKELSDRHAKKIVKDSKKINTYKGSKWGKGKTGMIYGASALVGMGAGMGLDSMHSGNK